MRHGDLFQDSDGDWCIHIEEGNDRMVARELDESTTRAGRLIINSSLPSLARIYLPYDDDTKVELNLFDILEEILK